MSALNIGSRALTANLSALQVIGHNMAMTYVSQINKTEGMRAFLERRKPQFSGR